MNRVKKLFLPVLISLICVFGLVGCSSELVLNDEQQFALDRVEEYVASVKEVSVDIDNIMAQYTTDRVNYNSLKAYKEAEAEFGAYDSFKVEAVTETDDDEFQVKGTAHFANSDATMTMTVRLAVGSTDYSTGEVTYQVVSADPIAFDKIKTFGEKMANAGLNTLLGVGIVFIVLILISFIISSFSLINKFQANAEAKKAAKEAANKPAAPAAPVVEEVEEEEDETELVAVIAAAIAAYEGTSVEGLVVRSIRKVSSANKWKRG